ncbi:hypothetical protein B0O80DRAFT_447363 [Mortierella sp. GBAus27b]|nr:hypothetical protein B0O80DRAFT_447363 [Mortierella sp. GBAus27b]
MNTKFLALALLALLTGTVAAAPLPGFFGGGQLPPSGGNPSPPRHPDPRPGYGGGQIPPPVPGGGRRPPPS